MGGGWVSTASLLGRLASSTQTYLASFARQHSPLHQPPLQPPPPPPRSFVYTLTFMASGAISATLTATATSLGVSATSRPPFVLSPSDAVTHQGALLLATAVLMVGGLVSLAKGATTAARANAVGVLTEAACGLLFAFGLTFTGMVRPAKVGGW